MPCGDDGRPKRGETLVLRFGIPKSGAQGSAYGIGSRVWEAMERISVGPGYSTP
jgi:hypothetical protein